MHPKFIVGNDLGAKNGKPTASAQREQSAVFFRETLLRFVWKCQRVAGSHPLPPLAKMAKHGTRVRINLRGVGVSIKIYTHTHTHTLPGAAHSAVGSSRTRGARGVNITPCHLPNQGLHRDTRGGAPKL